MPYFFWMESSSGISCLQGTHQLAQKLSMTTWPLYCASDSGVPARESSVKSGAGLLGDVAGESGGADQRSNRREIQ